jgi:uncharacterized protein GlcG (DUF336 family)
MLDRFPICLAALSAAGLLLATAAAQAAGCPVTHDQLKQALKASVQPGGGPGNGGLETNEWAAAVDRDGLVCAIAFSGDKPDDQWLASRGIAAEKAYTANALSLKQMALSTANLYAGGQPGGPLYGLANSNPVATDVLYAGSLAQYGGDGDPMLGKRLGGIIGFGGGLALYDANGILGGLGASGDTSCADHNIAWRMRKALGLDKVPAGVSPQKNDAIIYDIGPDGKSASGFGHPKCNGKEVDIAQQIGAGSAAP